jgi:hypothetical protein
MKRIFFTQLIPLMAISFCTVKTATAQPPQPPISGMYSIGFDNSSENMEWTEYKFSPPGSNYTWVISTDMPYSGTHCLAHYYPVGGTSLTDDWFVSPAFDFSNGATIDSLKYGFSGFGTPDAGDTVGIYILTGSRDPSLATSKVLLKDFRNTDYNNDGNWHSLNNVSIPSMSGNCYIAFRYSTTVNWLNVKYDDLYVTTSSAPTGIKGVDSRTAVRVYPNPASSKICITGVDAKQLDLYNSIGRKVRTFQASSTLQEIALDDIAAGTYIYTIWNKDGNQYHGKVVIQ